MKEKNKQAMARREPKQAKKPNGIQKLKTK